MEIKENTTVEEALKKDHKLLGVFKKYKLECPRCRGFKEDTIKKVAINNGLKLEAFLKELNSILKQ